MSSVSDCCSPCVTVQSIAIPGPEGSPGDPGLDGSDGVNAFTLAVAPDAAPVIQGGNTTVNVLNSAFMTVGQNVFAAGGYFQVVSKPTPTTAVLQLLVTGQNPATVTIIAGSQISPAGTAATALPSVSNYNLAGAQALTTAFAQLLTEQVTLTIAGTYLLFGTCRIDFAGATFAANQTVTVKLARSNNTPADVTNSIANVPTGTPTTATSLLAEIMLPVVQYTASSGDIIQMQGKVTVAPGAGAANAVETSLLAIQLF